MATVKDMGKQLRAVTANGRTIGLAARLLYHRIRYVRSGAMSSGANELTAKNRPPAADWARPIAQAVPRAWPTAPPARPIAMFAIALSWSAVAPAMPSCRVAVLPGSARH